MWYHSLIPYSASQSAYTRMATEPFLKPDRSRKSRRLFFRLLPSLLSVNYRDCTDQDSPASFKVLWTACALIYSVFSTCSKFCSKLLPVFHCKLELFASFHVEATMGVSLLWSLATHKVISYCALFRTKCSHYACHSEFFIPFVNSYRWH